MNDASTRRAERRLRSRTLRRRKRGGSIARSPSTRPSSKASAVCRRSPSRRTEHRLALAGERWTFVAEYLGMPPIAVYEVATFYAMYNPSRSARTRSRLHQPAVRAARRPARARALQEAARHRLRREPPPTARFTLKEGECLGACGDAPVMLVNKQVVMCSHDARRARHDPGCAELERTVA